MSTLPLKSGRLELVIATGNSSKNSACQKTSSNNDVIELTTSNISTIVCRQFNSTFEEYKVFLYNLKKNEQTNSGTVLESSILKSKVVFDKEIRTTENIFKKT